VANGIVWNASTKLLHCQLLGMIVGGVVASSSFDLSAVATIQYSGRRNSADIVIRKIRLPTPSQSRRS